MGRVPRLAKRARAGGGAAQPVVDSQPARGKPVQQKGRRR